MNIHYLSLYENYPFEIKCVRAIYYIGEEKSRSYLEELCKHDNDVIREMAKRQLSKLTKKPQTQTDISWGEELTREAGETEENRQVAKRCVEELLHDKFDLFFENASQLFKNETSYEVFRNVWRDTLDGLGECLAVEDQILKLPGVSLLCRFAELDVSVRFVFGENGIQGFWMEYKEDGMSKGLRLRC